MKIALASDHRGFAAKDRIQALLRAAGHEVLDFGCNGQESCDYPDLGVPAAEAVSRDECDRAILICGTGLGMSIVANKVAGVRAALCHDELTAEMSRKHNDANVLCLAADLLGEQLMRMIVETWLSTGFEGGRHARRIEKIARLERNCASD
jgi:ribose 5-phosphate isomerase B